MFPARGDDEDDALGGHGVSSPGQLADGWASAPCRERSGWQASTCGTGRLGGAVVPRELEEAHPGNPIADGTPCHHVGGSLDDWTSSAKARIAATMGPLS